MNILNIRDVEQLRDRQLLDRCEPPTPRDVRHLLELTGAMWLHDGNPAHPHAKLTKGGCSDGYINMSKAFKYPVVCELLARALVVSLQLHDERLMRPDWVVGSSYASITLAHEVAKLLGAMAGFTEKQPDGSQLWRRHVIGPNEVVLQVEELVTTLSTLGRVRFGVQRAHSWEIQFSPVVLVGVHRSRDHEFRGSPLLHAAHFDISSWDPPECPLCAQGSERVRPKENWELLTRPQ